MADKTHIGPTFTIAAGDNFILGSADAGDRPSAWFVSLTSSSFSGTITVKARKKGSSDSFAAIPYRKWHLNGSAGDGTLVTTGITGTSMIEIDSTGLDVSLDCGTYSSGSMAVRFSGKQG